MGSINIDNTGSGGAITLSSDGTSLLLGGSAVGGGGSPDLFAENYDGSSTKPTATGTNTIAMGQSAVAGNADDGIAIGRGANCGTATQNIAIGAFSDCGFNSFAMALGRLAQATGGSSLALGVDSAASHDKSVAIGKSNSNGDDSFAAQIVNNTTSYGAQGNFSIAMGYQAKATANYAFATGYQAQSTGNSAISMGFQANAAGQGVALGYKGTASGSNSFGVMNNTSGGATGSYSIAIGDTALASGNSAIAIGLGCQSDATRSVVIGARGHAQGVRSRYVFSGNSIIGNNDGSSQYGLFALMSDTTDATAEALTTNNSTPSATNQIILPNNSAYSFHGTIVARESATDGTDCAAWKIEGLIRREANAGTTTLVNSATTIIDNSYSWGMALSADTTNGGLKIEVTGKASTNIRWLATIHTSELIYA